MKTYKALTVHQPLASLIAAGLIRFTTRSWGAEMNFRGTLMIHAGMQHDERMTNHLMQHYPDARKVLLQGLPSGAIVCACKVVEIHRTEDIRDQLSQFEREVGNYKDGRYAWELDLLRVPEEPIPARGNVGLWNWKPD